MKRTLFQKIGWPGCKCAFAIFWICLASPIGTYASGINWKPVPVDEMEIIFRGEVLDLKFEKARKAWISGISATVEYSVWRNGWRHATIVKWQADPGRTYRIKDRLNDKASIKKSFGFTKSKEINWGKSSKISGALGNVDLVFLSAGERNCISWAFGYDDGSAGHPWSDSVNNVVRGLYCQKERMDLEFAKRVALLSGYKGGYVPPRSVSQLARIPGNENEHQASSDRDSGDWISVPIAASWEGVDNLMAGVLKYKNKSGMGPLRLDADDISCKGTWQFVSGKYGTDKPPTGTWAIACNNGLAASGTYVSKKVGAGGGRGIDADGRVVKVTFGKS